MSRLAAICLLMSKRRYSVRAERDAGSGDYLELVRCARERTPISSSPSPRWPGAAFSCSEDFHVWPRGTPVAILSSGSRRRPLVNTQTKTVYWHRELPPLEAEMLGEHTLEASSDRVLDT